MAITIEPSAFGPVRAVAAEHVVAYWLSEEGRNPVLHGGRRRGHDIADGGQLIDAKLLVPTSASEKSDFHGCTHKLRRDLWRPFDPARALVTAVAAGHARDTTGRSPRPGHA